jgi:hypothetical protein
LKPSINVKTKGSKGYLQVRTVFGDLIHIGPVPNIENWRVAYRALLNEYKALAGQDFFSLGLVMEEAGVNPLDVFNDLESSSKEWDKYSEKFAKSVEYRKKIHELYSRIPNPSFLFPGERKILRQKRKNTSIR